MGKRRKLREQVLRLLYQTEVGKSEAEMVYAHYLREESPDEGSAHFVHALYFGVQNHLAALDEIIGQFAQNWKLNRIAVVDKNILRMAVFEMLHMKDIPHVVSINEAVDIAKKYSTSESGKFVNGLLDKIKNEVVEK